MDGVTQFSRTELLIGSEGIEKLRQSRVAVFGVGGVGGFAAEALARAGVGSMDIFDNDTVSLTNINRQIIALHSTIGQPKVDVMEARLHDINPELAVNAHAMFYLPENADSIDLSVFDYVVDAVDTVAAKLEIISRCKKLGVPVISAMGAGNKLDPTRFRISDISKTNVCPLARVMRLELRRRGIKDVKAAWSDEPPIQPGESAEDAGKRRALPGSVSFAPSVMGLMIAGEVVRDLLGLTR